ncbi:MAG: acetyl-CoA carboxylase biotin carboxyl carrier protein [Pseudomonadota bacterium]
MSKLHVDTALIRELADLLATSDLTEIELETEGTKLKMARKTQTVVDVVAPAPALQHAPAAAQTPPPASAPQETDAPSEDPAEVLKSPMVGTAYISPEPGKPAFVSVGDQVKEGQTVLIVEAMKVMNPIKAHRSGTVVDVHVQNEQPIEYGEALLRIR